MRMSHPNTMTAEHIESLRASFAGCGGNDKIRREEVTGGVVFLSEGQERFYATGFAGKAVRPTFHFYFRSEQSRNEYITKWVQGLEAKATARAARANERKTDTHGLVKGSILYASWGFEQTNVDWYETVSVISDKTIELRQIAASVKTDEHLGAMSGYSRPEPGHYIGGVMRKRATSHGVRLTSFSHARPWNGEAKRCTWYA